MARQMYLKAACAACGVVKGKKWDYAGDVNNGLEKLEEEIEFVNHVLKKHIQADQLGLGSLINGED